MTSNSGGKSLRWYVLRTKPQSEYVAAATLAREGFELFFPRVKCSRLRRGHTDVPLFPGYLFLRCSDDHRGWHAAHRLPGVSGWVRFDGMIPAVPDEVIENLAAQVEAIERGGGLWKRLRPGERVRVVQGRMDCLARVVAEAASPQARVRVLMEFLGRQVSVQVPWQSIHEVSSETAMAGSPSGARRTRGRGRWIRGFGPRAAASPHIP